VASANEAKDDAEEQLQQQRSKNKELVIKLEEATINIPQVRVRVN